jgi:hypothetical protein
MLPVSDLRSRLPAVDVIACDLYGIQFTNGNAACPFPENHNHRDRDHSLRFDRMKGRIFCASQQCFGEKGADAFGFVQVMDSVKFRQAADKLAAHYGVNDATRHQGTVENVSYALAPAVTSRSQPAPIKLAASVREKLGRGGWAYHSHADFGDSLRQVRFEHSTKLQGGKGRPDKIFVWEHRIGDEWLSGAGGSKPPIYFNPTALSGRAGRLLLVEGWGKANAANALGIAAASLKEVSEANAEQLAGASVIIWPDNDAPGRKLAARASELLGKQNAEIFMIEPPAELSKGGDIVDALAMGWTRARIDDLMTSATRVTPARPFGVGDVRPVLEYSAAEIRYVVDRLIAAGTVTVLSGDSGCGKTTIAIAIANAVARGVPFGGMRTSKRPVIVLDRENPLPVVVDRNKRLGISDGNGLTIWGGWCPEEPPGPLSEELLSWVAGCDSKPFIIFDSLISYFDGQSENDSAAIRRYTQGFRKLAEMGCTVLVLHHSGKGETTKDFRGSSDIKASIDTGWHLANFGEGRLERLRLRAWKCRFAIAPDLLLTYADGEFLAEESSTLQSANESLTHLLKANPGIKAAAFEALARDRSLGRDRARKFLKEGEEAKRINRQRGDHNSAFYSWAGDEND